MKNIKNIIQIPDNLLLYLTRFTGQMDRFACICSLFKIIQEKNNEYYKNITQNCNIFGKLQKILESNNEYYLKMFWSRLESYELYHEIHATELLDERLLEMIVKYKSVGEIIRMDHFRSDFETQCKFIKLIGKYKNLDDIKVLVRTDCFIIKIIDLIIRFNTPSTEKHYTWQYNLAIGLYESGKYDKMDYLYSNLSLNDSKTFPYSGLFSDGSVIHSGYIKSLCNWTTFENFQYIKLNGTIIVEGNEIIIPRLFGHKLNYIQIAKGLCSSNCDDTRLLEIINKKGSLSYVSLLYITVFYQNTNIMNYLIEEILNEIEEINVEIAEIKAYQHPNNVDIGSTFCRQKQNYLDEFLEIGKYILLAYGFATPYPKVQDFLIEKFSKNHHLLFEEEDYLKSTKKFKQIYDEHI